MLSPIGAWPTVEEVMHEKSAGPEGIEAKGEMGPRLSS